MPSDNDLAKGRFLARVEREKTVSASRMVVNGGMNAETRDEVAKTLEAEGKIKVWRNGRACSYTLPYGESPWGGLKVIPKPTKKPVSTTREPVVRNRKSVSIPPPKIGGGGAWAPPTV